MATPEERLTVLETEMAKLPIKTQVTQLTTLLTDYKNTTTALMNDQATQIGVLEARIKDLLERISVLEAAP